MTGLAILMIGSILGAGYASWQRVHGLERPVALEELSAAHDPHLRLHELNFFCFDTERMSIGRINQGHDAWYEIRTQDPSRSKVLGAALLREMSVDDTGVLELRWRARNSANRIDLNLIEKAKPGSRRGPVFTRTADPIDGMRWERSLYAVTEFQPSQFQDIATLGNAKIIQPQKLAQLDIVILPGDDFRLDIQSIRMTWDPHRRWILGCTGLLALALLSTLAGGFGKQLMSVNFPNGLIGAALTSRLSLLLTLIYWSIIIGHGRDPGTLSASIALAFGSVLASLPGAFQFTPAIRHRLWGIRNLLVWGLAIALGLNLDIFSTSMGALITLMPSLESRDRRIFFVNGLGVIIGLFATLPFEMAGNRILPALLASAVVAAALIFMERIGFARSKGSTASVLKLYEGLFHHSPDAIFICDKTFRLQTLNPGFLQLTQRRPEELKGMDFRTLIHEDDVPALEQPWAPEEESRSLVIRYRSVGKMRHTLTRIQQLVEQGEAYGFQAISADITHEKELEEELRATNERLFNLSREDGLTGVANRRAFDEHLEQEWQRATRHHSALAVAIVDIDFFKTYNDTYGHPAGDACLQQVAAVLAHFSRRGGELLARYGGEEFAYIFPLLSPEAVKQICEQILVAIDVLAIPHKASGAAPTVSVSIGAACGQGGLGTLKSLVAQADAALYRAKTQGRKRAIICPEA